MSAEPRWPWEHRSRVPYTCRWAPYARAHEPGQGQLPLGSIRPRGYGSARTAQPRATNVVGRKVRRYRAGTPAKREEGIKSPHRDAALGDRLVELLGDHLDALGRRIERGGNRRLRRLGAVGGIDARILQRRELGLDPLHFLLGLRQFVGKRERGHDREPGIADLPEAGA